ncbi:NAD-dependent epimerase/dehydratase [Penicillium cf. griseofulvum]|uniref:NAD-dependent epimerase/dehydratase n=1 Tax=Penicillium cf. griseofulvum TaxID=2972120 RepID=A0A9W9IX63_9EURO|nr:NAD-dependent epimerase/dehydratase [Penicillium cf. griseofulvum]
MLDANFTYSKELFQGCKSQGVRFIYASSAAVYENKPTFTSGALLDVFAATLSTQVDIDTTLHLGNRAPVFVWNEREVGMRRWTDGKSWSASRISVHAKAAADEHMSKEEHCKLTVSCEDGRAIGTDKSPDRYRFCFTHKLPAPTCLLGNSSRLHCEEANSHIPGNSGPVLLPQLSYISASVREIIQIDFLAALPPSYPSNFSVTSTQPPCVEQRKFLPAGEPSPMMMWCGTECASSISHNTLIQGVLRDVPRQGCGLI